MNNTLITLSFLGLITTILALKQARTSNHPLRRLPSPPGIWGLGNMLELLTAVNKGQYSATFFQWGQKYPDKYVVWIGNRPLLTINNPKTIEEILLKGQKEGTFTRSPVFYKAYESIFGTHMANQTGEEWKWRRQSLVPNFKANRFSQKLDSIKESCEKVVESINDAIKLEQPIKVDPLFINLTMGVISYFLFGIAQKSDGTFTNPSFNPVKLYNALGILEKQVLLESANSNKILKLFFGRKLPEFDQSWQDLQDFLNPQVALALTIARERSSETAQQADPLVKQSILVQLAKSPKYSQDTLLAESMALMFAGHDTTAHTLSFIVGELGMNPHILQKAQAEVDRVWEKTEGLAVDSLDQLTYLTAIIQETMRLHPIVPGIPLITTCETEIDGVTVPQGVGIELLFLGAGRNEEMYPNPNKFDPDRWLVPPQARPLMLGFSLGAHGCVGNHLALLEATVMLALLLRRFNWELVNGGKSLTELDQNLTIFPRDRMPVRFSLR